MLSTVTAATVLEALGLLIFLIASGFICLHDVESLQIPDRILLPTMALVTGCLVLASWLRSDWETFAQGLTGTTFSLVAYLLLYWATQGELGFGDVKLAGLLGLVTGWHHATGPLLAILITFAVAGLFAIGQIATRKITWHAKFAFAPWMVFGAVAALTFV